MEPEDVKDVNPPESSPEEEVVVAPPTTEEEVQQVNINEVSPQDERGVSVDNVTSEFKRKYEELLDRQPELISEAVQKAFKQQNTEKNQEFTDEQLDLVIYDDSGTYDASNKAWASREKTKRQESKMENLIKRQLGVSQEQQQQMRIKSESEQYVVETFPEMFNKDATGRVSWNAKNPMTQLVAKYMATPQIKARPDALREATRQAFVDYQLATKAKQQQQSQLKEAQMAQGQKQNMGGGSGSVSQQSVNSAEYNAAYERFKQNPSDMRAAAEFNKIRRRLQPK